MARVQRGAPFSSGDKERIDAVSRGNGTRQREAGTNRGWLWATGASGTRNRCSHEADDTGDAWPTAVTRTVRLRVVRVTVSGRRTNSTTSTPSVCCTTSSLLLRDGGHHVEAADHPRQDTVNANTFDRQEADGKRMHERPPCQRIPKARLLRRWSDMPQHLQFNPHIRTGYRPLMTVGQCLRSLFYFHNETVNIMTHGFAILYMLLTIPQLLPWSTKGILIGILSWCHLIGAVSPWIGSFLYHLFMNLNYDAIFYRALLKLDMIGIWLCQSVGAIPMMAATVHCLPNSHWYCCMFIYCSLSIWGLLKAMNARSPWERRLCFAPPFLMRMLVLTLRCFGIGGGSPDALYHIALQDLIAVVGATIGALRIPEKWIPGKLDLMLNSHNLMHVLVVLAVCSMHAATLQDLTWMCDPSTCSRTNSVQLQHGEL